MHRDKLIKRLGFSPFHRCLAATGGAPKRDRRIARVHAQRLKRQSARIFHDHIPHRLAVHPSHRCRTGVCLRHQSWTISELAATPRAVIVVAVKGHDPEFDECLRRLFAQDYPAYESSSRLKSENDPAVTAIEPYRRASPDRVTLVVAGLSRHEGQKTTNLLAAVARLAADDEILVFADADIWPESDWLRRLIAPLADGSAEIVTGFSWMIVKDGKLSSLVLTAMAASVATIPRLPMLNGVWGGSAAMRQRYFHDLDMTRHWRGTLSDDLQLTNIAQTAGARIAVPREILLRTAIYTKGSGTSSMARGDGTCWCAFIFPRRMPRQCSRCRLSHSAGSWPWPAPCRDMACALLVLSAALSLSILRTFGRYLMVKRFVGRCRRCRKYAVPQIRLAGLAACHAGQCIMRLVGAIHAAHHLVRHHLRAARPQNVPRLCPAVAKP